MLYRQFQVLFIRQVGKLANDYYPGGLNYYNYFIGVSYQRTQFGFIKANSEIHLVKIHYYQFICIVAFRGGIRLTCRANVEPVYFYR